MKRFHFPNHFPKKFPFIDRKMCEKPKMGIVERLRGDYSDERLELAADEIERLREALHTIGYGPPNEGEPLDLLNQFVDLARKTLEENEK